MFTLFVFVYLSQKISKKELKINLLKDKFNKIGNMF